MQRLDNNMTNGFTHSSLIHHSFIGVAGFPGSGLSDGQWHSVELNSRRGRLTVAVDKEEGGVAQASPSFSLAVEGHLFFVGRFLTFSK